MSQNLVTPEEREAMRHLIFNEPDYSEGDEIFRKLGRRLAEQRERLALEVIKGKKV